MLESLFLLFSACSAVYLFLEAQTKIRLTGLEKLSLSFPVSAVLSAWVGLFYAFLFKDFNSFDTLSAGLFFAACTLIVGWSIRKRLKEIPKKLSEELALNKGLVALLLVALVFSIYFASISYLNPQLDGLYTVEPVGGDLLIHEAIVNSFLTGANSGPYTQGLVNPAFSGTALTYTFVPDLHAALLVAGGLSLHYALIILAVAMILSLVTLLYFLGLRFTGKKQVAILGVFIIMLAGGTHFLSLPVDFIAAHTDFGTFITHLHANYLQNTPSDTMDYYWWNMAYNLLFPQRSCLYVFPLVTGALILIYNGLKTRGKERRDQFLLAGVIVGMTPLVQGEAMVSVGIISAVALLLNFNWNIKEFLNDCAYLAAPACILAAPQILYVAGQLTHSRFVYFQPVWAGYKTTNLLLFALKNLSMLLPLALIGWILLNKEQRKFYCGFLALFVIASVIGFQPQIADNNKLLNVAIFLMSFVAALVIWKIYSSKNFFLKLLSALLFLSIVASVLIALVFMAQYPYRLHSFPEIQLGNWVAANTPSDAVFLSTDYSPAMVLAGRSVVLGGNWLWSWGYDESPDSPFIQRFNDVPSMLVANPGTHALYKKYGVNYVEVPDVPPAGQSINYTYLNATLPIAYTNSEYTVYKVT